MLTVQVTPQAVLALPSPSIGNFQQLPPWQQASIGFLASKKNPNTLRQYTQMLEQYLEWCHAAQVDPMTAVEAQVQMYLNWLQNLGQNDGKGYSESTISSYWGVCLGFYKYATRAELIRRNPAEWIEAPKVDHAKQKCTFLAPNHFSRFLETAEIELSAREYAIIAVLARRALRISEACNLDVTDYVTIRGQKYFRYIGKGNKQHEMPCPADVAHALDKHLDGREVGPLLLNSWGGRLTRKNATDLIRKTARLASVDTDISPHSLRRSFITYGRSMGMSLDQMQETVGHANPTTTARYDRLSNNAGRDKSQEISSHLSMLAG